MLALYIVTPLPALTVAQLTLNGKEVWTIQSPANPNLTTEEREKQFAFDLVDRIMGLLYDHGKEYQPYEIIDLQPGNRASPVPPI